MRKRFLNLTDFYNKNTRFLTKKKQNTVLITILMVLAHVTLSVTEDHQSNKKGVITEMLLPICSLGSN